MPNSMADERTGSYFTWQNSYLQAGLEGKKLVNGRQVSTWHNQSLVSVLYIFEYLLTRSIRVSNNLGFRQSSSAIWPSISEVSEQVFRRRNRVMKSLFAHMMNPISRTTMTLGLPENFRYPFGGRKLTGYSSGCSRRGWYRYINARL